MLPSLLTNRMEPQIIQDARFVKLLADGQGM